MEVIALLIWTGLVAAVVMTLGRGASPSVGLPLAFVLSLTMVHFFGGAIHIFGWQGNRETENVLQGFIISTVGLAAFVVGSQLVATYALRALKPVGASRRNLAAAVPAQYRALPEHLLMVGLGLVLVVFPLLGDIPTLTALSFAGALIVIVGICLGIWRALLVERSRRKLIWTLVLWGFGLPLFTLLTTHNVIRAIVGLFVILSFVVVKSHARAKILALGLVIVYVGLSLGVAYLAVRDDLRVDASSTSTLDRLETAVTRLSSIEPFNPANQKHLDMIDARMNQNILVGTAQSHLEAGLEEYAKGETLVNSLIALVPRVLWPDKPIYAGGMRLATKYTGVEFDENTSVGLGPILEFYLNFGTFGVLLGMLLFGTAVGVIDIVVATRLENGDWAGAIPLFVLGLSTASVEGAFVEITVSAIAGWIMGWVAVRLFNRFRGNTAPGGPVRARRSV